jgi:hypothetical protein
MAKANIKVSKASQLIGEQSRNARSISPDLPPGNRYRMRWRASDDGNPPSRQPSATLALEKPQPVKPRPSVVMPITSSDANSFTPLLLVKRLALAIELD